MLQVVLMELIPFMTLFMSFLVMFTFVVAVLNIKFEVDEEENDYENI
jgi:hypothetical protein